MCRWSGRESWRLVRRKVGRWCRSGVVVVRRITRGGFRLCWFWIATCNFGARRWIDLIVTIIGIIMTQPGVSGARAAAKITS